MKKIKLFAMALLSLVASGAMAGGVVDLNTSTATNNWYTEAGVGAVTNKSGNAFSDPDLTTCTPAGKKTGNSYFTIQVFNATKELIITAQSSSNRSLSSIATGSEVACGTALTKDDDYTISGGGESYIIPKNTCGNQFSIAFANPIPANDYVKITLSGNADIVDVTFVDAADAPYPYVKSFKMGEIEAEVDTAAKTITAVLPFGTDRTEAISYADVVMGGTAKNYGISDDVLTAIDSVDQSKNILYDLSGIIVSTTQYFTVSYMDGSTLLGSEQVEKDSVAVNYAQFQVKPLSTFVNWYTEPAKTNIADFANTPITEDKSFYGDWNVRYADSVDFAAVAASKPKIDSLLTAKGYAYKLGSLTDWDTNGELYTGYKFKNSGDSIQFNLKENQYFIMNLGAIKTPLYVSHGATIDTLGTNTASTSEYEYQAIGGDQVITLFIKAKNTVVFKQFNIVAEKIATADLKSITVNGTVIPGFKKDSLNYTYALPYGTTEMPVIVATPADKEAVAVVDPIDSLTQLVNIVVTNGELQKTYTVQLSVAAADKFLYEVVFSNGAKGAINNTDATIVVPYLDGTDIPTYVSDSVSAGATVQMTGEDKLTVTGEDLSEKEFSIEFKALSAPSFSADTITFDGSESYVYAHYGWDAGKGYKFSKDVNDAGNMRITEGKSRLYMALPACYSVNLISGTGGKKNIKVIVNGEVSSVTSTAAENKGIDILLSTTEANFIAIESNGNNGDGGFIKMVMTLSEPTKLADIKAGEKAEKFILDGKVYLRHGEKIFNAMGQEMKF